MNEILGNENGVSKGLGGSQVILSENFFSNGIIGYHYSYSYWCVIWNQDKRKSVFVFFLLAMELWDRVFLESLNMSSLYNLPILFVVEQNNISQSTNINEITSGSLQKDLKVLGLKLKKLNSKQCL